MIGTAALWNTCAIDAVSPAEISLILNGNQWYTIGFFVRARGTRATKSGECYLRQAPPHQDWHPTNRASAHFVTGDYRRKLSVSVICTNLMGNSLYT